MNIHQALRLDEGYRPRFPADRSRFGIAIVGTGSVARKWHVPTYLANGLRVTGVWDKSAEATDGFRRNFPDVPVYPTLEALLTDTDVVVLDLATTVVGRADLIERALAAGKHLLIHKPLSTTLEELRRIQRAAGACPGLRVAVNQNGRWAPQWRVADLLIGRGTIGEVFSITHQHDFRINWVPDLSRHGSPHFLAFDYCIHWIDISLCWLGDRRVRRVWANETTRAQAGKPELISQTCWIALEAEDGASVLIRSVADASDYSGHPFVIHGTRGLLRGSVDSPASGDWLQLERSGEVQRFDLAGNWFPDGFAGSMGELLCAIAEERGPYHSLTHAGRSHEVVLACCASIENGGVPVEVRPAWTS